MDAIALWSRLSALLGAALFAAGGATMGSMNAGWFGLERDANSPALLAAVWLGRCMRLEGSGAPRGTSWLSPPCC